LSHPLNEEEPEQVQSFELKAPSKGDPPKEPWSVVAYNKSRLADWEQLVRNTEQNAINAFDWLVRNPIMRMPGRCYPLRHSQYRGHWCYEIGAGDRLYYRPYEDEKKVVVWYAGKHPKDRIPLPPRAL
jgi:hypothetical protein